MKYQPLPLQLPDQAGNTKYFCSQNPNLPGILPPFQKHCVFAILMEKPVCDLVSWITLLPAEVAKIVQGTNFGVWFWGFFWHDFTPLRKHMPGHYFSAGTYNS